MIRHNNRSRSPLERINFIFIRLDFLSSLFHDFLLRNELR